MRREYPDAYRIDLLDEALYQSYLADVGRFAGELQAVASGGWVFVDEIQRLPGLLNEVHRHIEGGGLRFILTGSSARKLKRAGVNLLGGRAVHTRMYPFLPHELGTDFDLDTVLRHGSLPVIWNADDRAAALRSYVQLYLKEEIKGEALVRNLAGFARFMPVAALFHGQTLNIASAARDAEVSRTTLAGYVDILEDTLVAFRLPAYDPKLRVRERKHPKLYWIDPGMARAAAGRFRDLDPRERGPLFEGWIATVLASYRDYHGAFDEMYYWAPAQARDTEVDFLLLRDGESIAIEAKASARVHDRHLAGAPCRRPAARPAAPDSDLHGRAPHAQPGRDRPLAAARSSGSPGNRPALVTVAVRGSSMMSRTLARPGSLDGGRRVVVQEARRGGRRPSRMGGAGRVRAGSDGSVDRPVPEETRGRAGRRSPHAHA